MTPPVMPVVLAPLLKSHHPHNSSHDSACGSAIAKFRRLFGRLLNLILLLALTIPSKLAVAQDAPIPQEPPGVTSHDIPPGNNSPRAGDSVAPDPISPKQNAPSSSKIFHAAINTPLESDIASVETSANIAHQALLNSNNAWVLMSSAMVLFMTAPGLALFYSGLVRKKNVLSVFIQCLFLTSVMTVVWCCYGYSLTFGHGGWWNRWIGGSDYLFLHGVSSTWNEATGAPVTPMWSKAGQEPMLTRYSHMIFQGMFFVLAPAIMCGALAERIKFHGLVAFSILWGTFVYCPIAHWIWGQGLLSYPHGLLGGSLDFAGGSVVHVTSGVSALVASMVIGPRLGFGRDPMPPHNLTYTAMGAAMLWFGWFGFNAGSAFSADAIAASAFATTHLAAAAGAMGWWFIEWRSRGKPTVLGVSSGMVAGLVSITPAAGFVHPMPALLFGLVAGVSCYYACSLCKHWVGYDDSLDAFGIHGVAGAMGALLTGVFATRACGNVGNGQPLGYLEGGHILAGQAISLLIVILYAGLVSLILLKAVDWTIGLRVPASDERQGLDIQQHGEEGYIFL